MYRESISMIEMSLSLQTHYPVNYLRNIALNNARTQFIFLTDIDFLPMVKKLPTPTISTTGSW